MKKIMCLMIALLISIAMVASAFAEEEARTAFIDRIIATAKDTFDQANGKLQRAQYAGDIYVCKNFTVYLFRQNRDAFRMEEFPGVELIIPDNLPKKECTTYAYGVQVEGCKPSEGNPFIERATFGMTQQKP